MPVNVALGHLSNAFMIATLIIYSLSVFAFAGDFAFGRPRRAAAVRGQQEARDREAALATVGAASAAAAGRRPRRGSRRPRSPGGVRGRRCGRFHARARRAGASARSGRPAAG